MDPSDGSRVRRALPSRPGQAQPAPAERVATIHRARTADPVTAGRWA